MPDEVFSFLPLNCGATRPGRPAVSAALPLLARVDATRLDELAVFNWTTSPRGVVSRSQSVNELSHQAGKRVYIRFSLAATVLGVERRPGVRTGHYNGDALDCRLCNLFEGPTHAQLGALDRVAPGSSFSETLEFKEARLQRLRQSEALSAQVRPGRSTRLSGQQVRSLLDELASSEFTHGWTLQKISEIVESETGQKLSLSRIRAIIRGDQQRQPGFDYANLAKLFPDRAAKRALRLAALPAVSE